MEDDPYPKDPSVANENLFKLEATPKPAFAPRFLSLSRSSSPKTIEDSRAEETSAPPIVTTVYLTRAPRSARERASGKREIEEGAKPAPETVVEKCPVYDEKAAGALVDSSPLSATEEARSIAKLSDAIARPSENELPAYEQTVSSDAKKDTMKYLSHVIWYEEDEDDNGNMVEGEREFEVDREDFEGRVVSVLPQVHKVVFSGLDEVSSVEEKESEGSVQEDDVTGKHEDEDVDRLVEAAENLKFNPSGYL